MEEQIDEEIRTYYEDLNIARALLDKDKTVTMEFFFKDSYPLFKKLYDRYDYLFEDCYHLMMDVYVLILTRNKTGKCPLDNYKGKSTLRSWIKSVATFYCIKIAKKRDPIGFHDTNPGIVDVSEVETDTIEVETDTLIEKEMDTKESILDFEGLMHWVTLMNKSSAPNRVLEIEEEMDKKGLDRKTLVLLISKMKNKRYANIMQLLLIEHHSLDEMSTMLGMKRTNLNNTLSRAKRQFKAVYGKEVQNV